MEELTIAAFIEKETDFTRLKTTIVNAVSSEMKTCERIG